MKKSRHHEDTKQIVALEEFTPSVREILRGYRKKRKLASIAKCLGFHPSRLTEMITKNAKGEYKRHITPYYLARLIDGGFVDVKQILDGRKLEDLHDRVRIFFTRMILSRETIELVVEAQDRGIDVDRILREMLYPTLRER